MVVLEAHHLVREVRDAAQVPLHGPRQVEHDVIGGAVQPHDDVVLCGRKLVPRRAGQRLVEARQARRSLVRRDPGPELGAEAGDHVDATDRRARLAQ